MDDNEDEKHDICHDYPDTYDKLHKEEFGYRKGISQLNIKEYYNNMSLKH